MQSSLTNLPFNFEASKFVIFFKEAIQKIYSFFLHLGKNCLLQKIEDKEALPLLSSFQSET